MAQILLPLPRKELAPCLKAEETNMPIRPNQPLSSRCAHRSRGAVIIVVVLMTCVSALAGCSRKAPSPEPARDDSTATLHQETTQGSAKSPTAHINPTETASPEPTPSSSPHPTAKPTLNSVAQDGSVLRVVNQIGGATRALALLNGRVLFGHGSRVSVADVSDPDNPFVISEGPYLQGIVNGIIVDGETIWVITSDAALHALAFVDGTHVALLSTLRLPAEPLAFESHDGHLFIAVSEAGLVSVDGRDPVSPTILHTLAMDGQKQSSDRTQKMALVGSTVWFADDFAHEGKGGLYAVDVSIPNQLKTVGDRQKSVDLLTKAGENRLFVYRRDFELLDVQEPTQPSLIGTQTSNLQSIAEVRVSGEHALAITSTVPPTFVSFRLDNMSVTDGSSLQDHREDDRWGTGLGPIVTDGSSVYIAGASTAGFESLDFSNGIVNWRGSLNALGSSLSVVEHDHWAYVTAGGRLTAWDVSDPGSPRSHDSVILPQWSPTLSILKAEDREVPSEAVTTSIITPMVIASGITSDAFGGEVTTINLSEPPFPRVQYKIEESEIGGHVSAAGHIYLSASVGTKIFAVGRSGQLKEVSDWSPWMLDASGSRGIAQSREKPRTLLAVSLDQPYQPALISSFDLGATPISAAIQADHVYVLTKGSNVQLRVLEGLETGNLHETGSVIVDPSAYSITPISDGALIGFGRGNIYAQAHAGVVLIVLGKDGIPRVADTLQLPTTVGQMAIAEPYVYLPAGPAGMIIARIDKIESAER